MNTHRNALPTKWSVENPGSQKELEKSIQKADYLSDAAASSVSKSYVKAFDE